MRWNTMPSGTMKCDYLECPALPVRELHFAGTLIAAYCLSHSLIIGHTMDLNGHKGKTRDGCRICSQLITATGRHYYGKIQ